MKLIPLLAGLLLITTVDAQVKSSHNLRFTELPKQWDEALPIGNGWLGALIWQRDAAIRLSLDRVDLWDDRPMPQINRLTYKWVEQQVINGEYDSVQQAGDRPYDENAAPSKIPGAALEFKIPAGYNVQFSEVSLKNGLAMVEFNDELRFLNYVHASKHQTVCNRKEKWSGDHHQTPSFSYLDRGRNRSCKSFTGGEFFPADT